MKMNFNFQSSLILVISVVLSLPIFAQTDISGLWRGYNTQEAAGSYSTKYDFEIYINEKAGIIIGRSYATVGDIYAEMEIVGEFREGKYLHFQETKVVDFKAEDGMEWCIKKGVLTLFEMDGKLHFRGTWQGTTSFSNCIPGKVYLDKVKPRA